MPDTVTVPSAPALSSLPNVELMRTGEWDISTGRTTFTREDLAAAVGALDCPAVRRPVLKLGHVDERFDGEPAVGWVGGLATADSGHLLVGDYVGMPGWLGPVIASAYPDRSIEGAYDWRCQLGHCHPFVVHAVALLGVSPPGIGTLGSLQDVATLYGVAASAEVNGTPVTIRASQEAAMPNPSPLTVAAGVTTEDIRRAYYDTANWSWWICEMQLDPDTQLIVQDDTSGYARVPVTISGDAITFGTPVPVSIQYVDKPAVAAAAGREPLRYATRAESRPGNRPQASPPTLPATEPETIPEGGAIVALDEGLRTRLGLAADADEDTILAALDAQLTAPPPTPAPAALPDGVVVVEAAVLEELRAGAAQGLAARQRQLGEDRDRTIDAAIRAGKTTPARREHWVSAWAGDPEGTATHLASLAPGLVPVDGLQGVVGGDETATGDDAVYNSLYPTKAV